MSTGEVIVKILSGGAVGYLTNLLAIKMLFKKYPLVGGDLISSAYPQIENNLTKIVEKSLSQNEISSLEN